MARPASSWCYGFLALTALACLGLVPAAADVRVTKSDEPTIQKGTVLSDDAVLDIPATKTVKVLLLPAGVSKVLTGPYKGTAKDYAPSTIPSVGAKPAAEYDFGTTINSPLPPR